MGLEDRDWYREETARKNGLRYNAKNATYSRGEQIFSEALRTPVKSRKFQPFLLFLFTVVICGIIFVVLKIISQLLR